MGIMGMQTSSDAGSAVAAVTIRRQQAADFRVCLFILWNYVGIKIACEFGGWILVA